MSSPQKIAPKSKVPFEYFWQQYCYYSTFTYLTTIRDEERDGRNAIWIANQKIIMNWSIDSVDFSILSNYCNEYVGIYD